MKTPLDRALNDMTTTLSRDHSEKEWKWAIVHVLRALAVEIQKPIMQIIHQGPISPEDVRLGPVKPGPADDGGEAVKKIMSRLKEKQGPDRQYNQL